MKKIQHTHTNVHIVCYTVTYLAQAVEQVPVGQPVCLLLPQRLLPLCVIEVLNAAAVVYIHSVQCNMIRW